MTTTRFSLFLLAVSLPPHAFAEEGLSVGDGARMLWQIQMACRPYSDNGERFWRGELMRVEDAGGLVLLNKEIQNSVRKSRNAELAKEIAWQKCLDFVFNNQNSNGYVK